MRRLVSTAGFRIGALSYVPSWHSQFKRPWQTLSRVEIEPPICGLEPDKKIQVNRLEKLHILNPPSRCGGRPVPLSLLTLGTVALLGNDFVGPLYEGYKNGRAAKLRSPVGQICLGHVARP